MSFICPMVPTKLQSCRIPPVFDVISRATAYFTPDFPTHELIQIQNYKTGKALIVNFHLTHHAGTTLYTWARDNGHVAPFACMGGNVTPPMLKRSMSSLTTPWYYNKTDYWIQKVRPVFLYISWKYGLRRLQRSLNHTNWEHPNLASIVVMRNPIDRLLSDVGRHSVKNGTSVEWWDYAQNIRTNNYALRTIMSNEGCCNGGKTQDSYLEAAKSYLQRFTFVITWTVLMSHRSCSRPYWVSITLLNLGRVIVLHGTASRITPCMVRRNTKDMDFTIGPRIAHCLSAKKTPRNDSCRRSKS